MIQFKAEHMQIYNTLSRNIEEFNPISPPYVGMYTCGPTVYDYAHIGHMRKYINDDVLKRVLLMSGFNVRHVMNITDVGHLSSDEDAGEDKLEKGARKFGKDVYAVARMFEDDFFKSIKKVNILLPDVVARATEHIDDQVALIEVLQKKGYTYKTPQAIYFDVSKFGDYSKLSGQNLEDKLTGVRDGVIVDSEKKNPVDFALWFFTVGRFKDHAMRWDSPWGTGFPGWHIECSAMAMKYLGFTLDIHTGGVDHIPVHHTNEIAQSECATGQQFVKYWVHNDFLQIDGEKMSKSKENFFRIDDLERKRFNPLAFRYLTFLTHYRSEMNFTWKGLQASQNALDRLYEAAESFPEPGAGCIDYERDFKDALYNDINMPKAISILWEMLRSDQKPEDKAATLFAMDEVLGLKVRETVQNFKKIPQEILEMIEVRDSMRRQRKFGLADQMRAKIEKKGYLVKDEGKTTKVIKKL